MTERDEVIRLFRSRITSGVRQRLSKDNLVVLMDVFLDLLKGTKTKSKIKALCKAEIALLEEGYPRSTVAKYLTDYRKTITEAIEDGSLAITTNTAHRYVYRQRVTGIQKERLEHWALTYLKYGPEVYEELAVRSQITNRDKQLNLRLVPVDRYLEQLREFLDTSGPFADRWLAVAIAGLTGRRFGEVIAKGRFSLTSHTYLLHFEGQQKSVREQGYNILTLLPAEEILASINRLRQFPEIRAITLLKGEALKTALNVFNRKLNAMCSETLQELVPPLEGKQTVTIHNLRGVYGAIAVYLFCPPHQHEYAFIQNYLGHVMSSAATGHYFRYALADKQGNPLRDKGILLDKIRELPIPIQDNLQQNNWHEAEQTQERQEEGMVKKQTNSRRLVNTAPVSKSRTTKPSDTKANEIATDWLTALEELRTEIDSRLTVLEQHSQSSWIISRLETLEAENRTLKQERDTAIAVAEQNQTGTSEIKRLKAENKSLSQSLQIAQAKLDGFRQLLNGTDTIEASKQTEPSPEKSSPRIVQEEIPLTTTIVKETSKPVRGPKPGKAFQRAETIYLAIKDWNQQFPSESFAINPGLLETVFRIHRQAAKDFLDAHQNELWEYHQELGVESLRWHNRGKDTQKLKTFVLEKLGV